MAAQVCDLSAEKLKRCSRHGQTGEMTRHAGFSASQCSRIVQVTRMVMQPICSGPSLHPCLIRWCAVSMQPRALTPVITNRGGSPPWLNLKVPTRATLSQFYGVSNTPPVSCLPRLKTDAYRVCLVADDALRLLRYLPPNSPFSTFTLKGTASDLGCAAELRQSLYSSS